MDRDLPEIKNDSDRLEEKKFRIALVVPVKNESKSIQLLLDSIDKQTRLPDEVIFVDGGSFDSTPDILEKYCRHHKHAQVLRLKEALPGEGRNAGVKASTSEVIVFTDAGVQLDPQWFDEITRPMREDPTIDVVYGDFEPVIDTWFKECSAVAYVSPPELVADGKRMRHHSIASCAVKRRVWEAVGGFSPLRSGEDLLFMDRIRLLGFREAFAPNARLKWDIPDNYRGVFNRFRLYAKWGIIAGKAATWHRKVFSYYVFALIGALVLFLMYPLYTATPFIVQNILRTLRQVVRSKHFNWIYTFRLDRIMCVAAVIFMVDVATFVGTLDWFRDRKIGKSRSCVGNFWASL